MQQSCFKQVLLNNTLKVCFNSIVQITHETSNV